MRLIFLSIFLSINLLAQSDFIKMCMNPTASQKVTIKAIAKTRRMEYGKEACKKIESYYITGIGRYESLESLTLIGQNITDITPLKYFIRMNELNLSDNKVINLSSLSDLTQLKKLDISNNPITDISSLENLIKLEEFSMYKVHVKNNKPLSLFKNLKSLSISEQTNVFVTIGQLVNLETLYVNRTNSKDVCDLNKLKKLQRLSFNKNNISDISCLNSLKEIEYLKIQNNPIANISVLSNYSKLKSINLSKTFVQDISVLEPLSNVVTVIINDTQVTDASPLSGKYMSIFSARNTPLRWCSPKSGQEIIDGVSCYEKDGTEKSWFKRLLRQ